MFKHIDDIPEKVVDVDKNNFLLIDTIIHNLKELQEHPVDRILYLDQDSLSKLLGDFVVKTAGFCYSHERIEVGK